MPSPKSPIGKSLAYWIQAKGISQAQLSSRAGLASSAVNDIIRSPDRSPRLETLEKLADGLGIDVWQLIAGPAEPSYEANAMPGGVKILPTESMSEKERAFYEERAEQASISIDHAHLGEVQNWDSVPLGFLPGELVAIIPAKEYMGETVAVRFEGQEFVGLRYCCSPWLVGYVDIGLIFHEYIQAPGLEILGAVRRIRFGRLETRPRMTAAVSSYTGWRNPDKADPDRPKST